MNNSLWLHIATLGPIGYLKMPGTIATLVTLPVMYYAKLYMSNSAYLTAIGCLIICSFIIINKALSVVQRSDDPDFIVLDEVIGCLVTFSYVDITWKSLIVGVLLFRFFDISKIFPVNYAELLIGSLGIICDDIVAAIMAWGGLYFINAYIFEKSFMLLGLW